MFSMLISVYAKEEPTVFNESLKSIALQTILPEEVVLVKDGLLGPELEAVIQRFVPDLNLVIVPLPTNVGLARALNEGLRQARQPWIMRFDSDDICLANRVQTQTAMAREGTLSLFGAQILEFENSPSDAECSRSVPLTHDAIQQMGQSRNPFNHMTVCYRRDLALSLGGYPEIPFMEDYALWMNMLSHGVETANSSEVLVLARTGNGMLSRRGGLRYAKSEWLLQNYMVDLGLKNRCRALLDGCVRSAVFLSPESVRAKIYHKFLRNRHQDEYC